MEEKLGVILTLTGLINSLMDNILVWPFRTAADISGIIRHIFPQKHML